jgi:hypothetical protein
MDALSGMLGSVGSLFGGSGSATSGIAPLAQIGTGVAGTVGNIEANNTRNSVLQQQMNYTNQLQNMTPAQLAQGIQQLQQPLSTGLAQSVGNTVQGQLSERGLSQAPGIYAQSLTQALAPYQLQEQQLATNAYLQKLGLPISSRPSPFGPYPASTNTTGTWQSLFQHMYGAQNPNNISSTPGLNYGPTDTQLGQTPWGTSLAPSTPDYSSGNLDITGLLGQGFQSQPFDLSQLAASGVS